MNPDVCWAVASGGVGERRLYPSSTRRCHDQRPHCHCLEQTGAWGRHETTCPVQGKEEPPLVNNGWHVVCRPCWDSAYRAEPVLAPISYLQTCCCCRRVVDGTTSGVIYTDTEVLADIIGEIDCEELHT